MSEQRWEEPIGSALDDEPLEFSWAKVDEPRVWDYILTTYSHKDFQVIHGLELVMIGRLPTFARSKAERVRLGKLRNASKPPFDQDAQ